MSELIIEKRRRAPAPAGESMWSLAVLVPAFLFAVSPPEPPLPTAPTDQDPTGRVATFCFFWFKLLAETYSLSLRTHAREAATYWSISSVPLPEKTLPSGVQWGKIINTFGDAQRDTLTQRARTPRFKRGTDGAPGEARCARTPARIDGGGEHVHARAMGGERGGTRV